MHKLQKLISIFAVLTLAILAGCGVPTAQKTGDAPAGNAPAAEGAKQLTIAGNGGKIEKAIRDEIAPKFKEKTGI